MKTIFTKTMMIAASAVVYSHAIFGIGGQWAPAPGLEVKSDRSELVGAGANKIYLNQAKVSGLQGFGLKLWIDALPFVDIEAGSNMQFGYYDVSVIGPTASDSLPLKFDLGVPMLQGKPVFSRIVSDVTILYPFLKLPPLISIVKVYAGGGISHVLSTEVLNSSFAKDALAKKATGGVIDPAKTYTADEVSKILIDGIIDEGLKSGIGFHIELGAKAKIPVIPIAIFADAKYHFLSSMPKAADANSLTYEMGAALAF